MGDLWPARMSLDDWTSCW